MMESQLGELSYRVLHAGGNHEVLWLLSLKDEPHTLHIVLGIAPVAERIQVAEIEFVLLTLLDAGSGKRNLTGYESLAATLALMVEENTRAAEHIVSLTILLHDPEAILFCHCVWRIRMERRILVLWHFLHLSIQLGS